MYRIGWSPVQNKVFNRVYKVLMSIRLARLAHSSTVDEPIHRRIYCDKHAKRVRQIFSSVSWVSRSSATAAATMHFYL